MGSPTPAGPAPRRLRPIFRDRAELAANPDLAARIHAALDDSAFLIVLCSPAAAASRWVEDEIRRFTAQHGPERVLSVIVGGEPSASRLAGRTEVECFPPALRDAATGAEPIAADLRPGGDGRRMVRLKLVAGMIGVGLDELVRRDFQRRHRALAAVSAASLLGMAAMGGLALAALMARDEARAQRAQAEGLVEYMLADLKTRLEDSGRLDLMDAVGRRALDYYRAQSPGGLDAASLGRRARALQLVGEVSALRGHMGEALRSFEAASATTAETLSRAPRDPDRIFDHAQSAFWVGDIAWQRGEMATAEANFQEYRRLADQLVARDPADDRWRAEVNYAYSSLGAVMIDDGRAIEAERDFQRSLAMTQALVAKHPGDTKRLIDLGQSHAWLATALEEQGRFAEARAHRRTELALYGPILDADPSNQGASFSAIVATRALARMALLEGDARTAVAGFSDAAARAERLLASQRDNMDVEAAAAIAEIDLAEALLAVGRLSPAQAAQERGAALAATALANDSTVALWRQCRDHARLAQAAIALRRGDAAGALRLDSATLAALAAPASGGGLNAEPRRLQLRAKLQAGDDLSALGQGAQARAQWSAIVTALRGPTSDYGPRLLLVLEAADTRLGRAGEAAAVARRLAQMGAGPGAAGRGRLSPARSRHTSGTRRP